MGAHAHDHAHGGHHHHHPAPGAGGALTWVLVANLGFFFVEASIGLWTGSLALLSDAGHALGDVGALSIAVIADRLARRPPSARWSFGLVRMRVLGAFVNGMALAAIAGSILTEAVHRMAQPAAPPPWNAVAIVGAIGLALNLGSAAMLARGDRGDVNLRAALAHVLVDALGSVAAVVAAILIWAGHGWADVAVGAVMAALVLRTAWVLMRDTATILLESAPAGIDPVHVGQALAAVPGVEDVHDLHVWSLDGRHALVSAHLRTEPDAAPDAVQREAHRLLEEVFHVHHRTLQVEITCRGGC